MAEDKTTGKYSLALIWIVALLLASSIALAVLDPFDNVTFYVKNQRPDITMNFSMSVNFTASNMTKGNIYYALINPADYSAGKLVRTDSRFDPLAVSSSPSDYYNYIFNVVSRKLTRLDTDARYKIVIDKTAPTMTIQPNNMFFSKSNDPNMTFSIRFNEPSRLRVVTINGVNFQEFNDSGYAAEFRKAPAAMSRSKTLYSKDGEKNIYVLAEDLAENSVEGTAKFTVNTNAELDIFLVDPKYGKSSKNDFNFVIGTDNAADCEFLLDRQNLSYGTMPSLEASEGGTRHTSSGFSIPDEDEGHYLWVACNDPFWKKDSYQRIEIGVDTSAPNFINAYALPAEIVEPPIARGYLSTAIYATTDDATICRYDDANDRFDAMRFNFSDNATFQKTHKVDINITSSEKKNYTYFISCINKAELETPKKQITFMVDLLQNLRITPLIPRYVNHSIGVDFRVRTNKQSACTLASNLTTNKNDTSPFTEDDGYVFAKELNLGGDGNYTFYVYCEAKRTPEKKTEAIRFTIDLTPPETPYVDDTSAINNSQYFYSKTTLRFNYSSHDPESGIKKYAYSIVNKETGENAAAQRDIVDSSMWGKWNYARGLNLSNLATYVFQVVATNWADLTSFVGESDGVTIDTAQLPEYCSNGVKDVGVESDVDCGKTCLPCLANRTCSDDSDCESDYCRNLVCTQPTCSDNRKNQEEGDIDCGGPCTECTDGRTCNVDSDCIDISSCSGGICKFQPDTCLNRKIDGGETDLNCGGPCEPCGADKACMQNSDCQSDDCEGGKCNSATCSDGKRNQKESDTDCGGVKCSGCEAGKACIRNSDCATENCQNFVCSKYSPEEWEERSAATKKLIWSLILFLLFGSLLGGGGYYSYRKGYFDKAIFYAKNIDWKTLKLKSQPMLRGGPAMRPQISPIEMKRREMLLREKAKKAEEQKMMQRKSAMSGFDGGVSPAQRTQTQIVTPSSRGKEMKKSDSQNTQKADREADDLFGKLDSISKGKKSAGTQEDLKPKTNAGLDNALSDLSKLSDDLKKKQEKKQERK